MPDPTTDMSPSAGNTLTGSMSSRENAVERANTNDNHGFGTTAKAEETPLPDPSQSAIDAEKANLDTTKETEKTTIQEGKGDPPAIPGAGFPDGGTAAWLCVFGSFWCLFCSFGFINAIGVFQDYYQSDLLADYSPSAVAWIPALETFCMFVGGPINGRIFDRYGPRMLLLVGTILQVFGLMMTSLSTQYYQFILAQGIVSSLGASAIFFPAVASTSTWFFHRRALAVGIVAAGSSLGGVVLPILVQKLIPRIGFPWTMRVTAFVLLGLLIISNLTVRSRLPPNKTPFKPSMLYKCFTEFNFAIFTAGAFLFFLAMFIPFNFLILQSQTVGLSPLLASYLIPILNAVSIVGRTLPGYLADKFGRLNVLVACCFFAAILTIALWLPGQGEAAVISYAVFFGFASGAFVSLLPAVIAQMSPIKEIGVRNGNLFAVMAFATLIGNPVAGALLRQQGGHYSHLQIFAGVFMLAGSTVLLLTRIKLVGFKMAKI